MPTQAQIEEHIRKGGQYAGPSSNTAAYAFLDVNSGSTPSSGSNTPTNTSNFSGQYFGPPGSYPTNTQPGGYASANPNPTSPEQQISSSRQTREAIVRAQNPNIDQTSLNALVDKMTPENERNYNVAPTPTPSSWAVVGKQKDPASVSAYLNTQPGFKTSIVGNTVQGTKNGVDTTWEFNGTDWVVKNKPTIATTDTPVIGNPPATTPKPGDFTTMTPEQLKAQYMAIGTKLPGEVTDEDRRFAKYLQTRIGLGETMDKIFGGTGASSGKTTYSTELVQPGENIASSVRNSDGSYQVTYKDGTSQRTTSEPSTTVFPEGTPEYFAQKKAQENQKQLDVLTQQMNTEAERRKKETADLVAKYGENIAGQFQSQKAEIEAQGAKRMETLNSGLSFSGFGRSTLALDKRDEIAKNIETTINQAKAKADLELMAYRMEQEGADAKAISSMRKNIADVQANIDQANYENQLEIIKLNQENATSGAEAMNNLLETISNSAEIVSNADLKKSQELGYFVDKNGALMLDSQKRPIQFEGTPGSLDPSAISSYADALKKGIIDEKGLDKLSPADKAAVLKHVAVQDGSWVGTGFVPGTSGMRTDRHNNPVAMTTDVAKTLGLVEGVDYTVGDPFNTGKGRVLYTARLNGDGLQTTIKALDTAAKDPNKKAFYTQGGGQRWTYIGLSDEEWLSKTPEEKAQVIATMYKNEGGNGSINAGTFVVGGGAGQTTLSNLSKEAQNIIAQINTQGGKPQDYILGTSKDSQALLQEVLQGLNTQGGSGTLASDTRTQSLALATKTIDDLITKKDLAGSFFVANEGANILGANKNTEFVNRVDALAGQLLQIDGPTLKAMFGPQISNSDVEAIKRTILQGLDPKKQTPESFEKTLNDVKEKMQAYINRLPKSNTTTPTNTVNPPPVSNTSIIDGLE